MATTKIIATVSIKIEEASGEITTMARNTYIRVNDTPTKYADGVELVALSATRQVLNAVKGIHGNG